MATLARCHLVMGNWEYAQMAAEIVLGDDKKFVQAIYAKAEALYNTCQFEHALVYFVRGQVRERESEMRDSDIDIIT